MRYAIFSDVHGNLPALQAVLRAARSTEQRLCCGDIVGYGAEPGACIQALRQAGALAVAGNHDWGALGRLAAGDFNPIAWETLTWTRARLASDERDFLRDLPLTVNGPYGMLVHGSPARPECFDYLNEAGDIAAAFAALEGAIGFVGHTHIPAVFEETGGQIRCRPAGDFTLCPGNRYLVNAGSVGQPRDGNPRAAFVLYDSASGRVEFRRVPYDIEAAQARIFESGLSSLLAMRLSFGH